MAFTEFYCQTTGSNLNAGSTTADAAVYTSPANGGWNSGTGIFTPVSGNPSATVAVGDFASVYLDAATVTGFVGRVTAVSTTTITVSITAKSGTIPTTGATGFTCKTGGAWKGPNAAVGFPFNTITGTATNSSSDQVRVNLKTGTNYAITAAITSNGAGPITFQGYTTTPGDGGRAVIDGGTTGASYTMLSAGANQQLYRDLILQNNGATGSSGGFTTNAVVQLERFIVHDVRGNGISTTGANAEVIECETYLCNTSNTADGSGFSDTGGVNYIRCIAHDNAGSNTNGFQSNAITTSYIECIADTNGSHGFRFRGLPCGAIISRCVAYNNSIGIGNNNNTLHQIYIENTILANNTTYGLVATAGTGQFRLNNNGYFGNTTAATSIGAGAAVVETGAITLASLPFTDAPNGDFRITLAAAKGAGRGTFLQTQASYAGTIGYPDIGAAQHKEPARKIPSIG